MRFSPQLLDEIRARLPVSQVVARKVALKKAGREFRGLSPFKTEKTPSFFVNDQKGFYHCFASGEHGDIFTFVMKTEGLSFPEAVERLAAEAGVTLPKPERSDGREAERADHRTRLYSLLEAAAAWFQSELAGSAGSEARGYLDRRGLGREIISRFRLGYAPAGRSALKEHLAAQGFTPPEMVDSGMLVAGDDIPVPYDRFRNRVMFPITDLKGRVIAFGGRALDAAAPAKYLNSPETPLFHKGATLFNAAAARQAALDRQRIIAVEGYMDVLALVEAGIPETVAPLGTALTEGQLQLLWRMAPEPILCFDGDGAGRRAAFRAVETVLPLLRPGLSLAFAFLPDGLDPDDLVRQQGGEALAAVLDQARPLADILWEREWNSGQWSTPERRARLERQIFALVGNIADPSVRAHYEQDMRARFAKAWPGADPSRRPGPWRAKSDWRQPMRDRTMPRSWTPGRTGAPNRGGGQPPAAPTPSLVSSSLVAGGPIGVPYREAVLLQTLINHPWLIDEDAEAVAALPFTNQGFARLRDALLSLHAEQNFLDRGQVETHLKRQGLAKILALVQRAITHKGDKFAEPEADRATVEAGWRHAAALHTAQVGVKRALMAAERAWHAEGSEEALARIRELQVMLGRGDGTEAVIEVAAEDAEG